MQWFLAVFVLASSALAQQDRPRAREAGIEIGILEPGPANAITDVPGVLVGHVTLVEGDAIRTGVTAILPHAKNVFQQKVPAAMVVGNGFGKLIGVTQVDELGTLETPIALTNTLSVFSAANGLIEYTLKQPGNQSVRSVNPVVGETNDGYLNDIRARVVTADHVRQAIDKAKSGPVVEGCVGAGTGTICFGFKGGIGTSSRQLPDEAGKYRVGVLVQTNFHGVLTIRGVPVGQRLERYLLRDLAEQAKQDKGSCMIVVATDAPVDARQLKRIARRALLGLGSIGSPMSHGSGDYVIAFSTNRAGLTGHDGGQRLDDRQLTPLFQATKESTEEAILNSLFRATTTKGHRGRKVEALPIERVLEMLDKK